MCLRRSLFFTAGASRLLGLTPHFTLPLITETVSRLLFSTAFAMVRLPTRKAGEELILGFGL
jgi:hypothetical protein